MTVEYLVTLKFIKWAAGELIVLDNRPRAIVEGVRPYNFR